MKKILIVTTFMLAKFAANSQPWNFERDFPRVFETTRNASFIYKETNESSGTFIEVYSKDSTGRKLVDYFVNPGTSVKNGLLNLYDAKSRLYCSFFFNDGVLEEIMIRQPDQSLEKYDIKNNQLNGIHSAYYASGSIKEYGLYKDNKRVGDWIFNYENGVVSARGSYAGNYTRLIYDYNKGNLIVLNNSLDTARIEKMTKDRFDSLRKSTGQEFLAYPMDQHYEKGTWSYFDETGKLSKVEVFDGSGRLIKSEIR